MWNFSLLAVKLLQIHGIGHRAVNAILNELKDSKDTVDDKLLMEIISRRSVKRKSEDEIARALIEGERIYTATLERGFKFTTVFDDNYPKKLLRLRYPPVILNYAGDISFCNDLITVTLSGTRHPTAHGYNILPS